VRSDKVPVDEVMVGNPLPSGAQDPCISVFKEVGQGVEDPNRDLQVALAAVVSLMRSLCIVGQRSRRALAYSSFICALKTRHAVKGGSRGTFFGGDHNAAAAAQSDNSRCEDSFES
jgi:hypothetical protein